MRRLLPAALGFLTMTLSSCDRVKEMAGLVAGDERAMELREKGVFQVVDGDPKLVEQVKLDSGVLVVVDYYSDT